MEEQEKQEGSTRSKGSGRDPEHDVGDSQRRVVLECPLCRARIEVTRLAQGLWLSIMWQWFPEDGCDHPLSSYRVKVPRHQR